MQHKQRIKVHHKAKMGLERPPSDRMDNRRVKSDGDG